MESFSTSGREPLIPDLYVLGVEDLPHFSWSLVVFSEEHGAPSVVSEVGRAGISATLSLTGNHSLEAGAALPDARRCGGGYFRQTCERDTTHQLVTSESY